MTLRRAFTLLFATIIFIGCNQKTSFTVNGELKESDSQTISLYEYTVEGNKFIDSVKVDKNGNFKFKSNTSFPSFFIVSVSEKEFVTLLVEPKEKVNLEINSKNFTDYTVKGSEGSELIKELNQRLIDTKKKLAAITKEYNASIEKDNFKDIAEGLNEKYRKILDTQRDSSIAFILNHMNSLASITALYQKFDEENLVLYKNRDIQYVKIVAESLEKLYPESPFVKTLIADKENLLKTYERVKTNKALSELTEGIEASSLPEIKLPNIKGDSIALTSLKEEVVLLSFWATWNKASLQQNILWKEIYAKYNKKGFEIYQVSLDTKKEVWEKAVNFDQLPWINVSDLHGVNSLAARIYNVQEVPTCFLIRNGEIIKRNPSIEELKRRLSIALD